MLLEGPAGQRFELSILKYQFPDLRAGLDEVGGSPDEARDPYRWLDIQIVVTNRDRTWRAVDPMLEEREAAELAEWLEDLAQGTPSRSRIEFTEPNLAFETVPRSGNLRVCFELEARPKDFPRFPVGDCAVWVEVYANPDSLRRAALSLREELGRLRSY